MPDTLAQRIIARAAGRDSVRCGDIVTCKVDLAMMHDSGGPRRVKPILDRLGAAVWDPDRVVVVTDHLVPAFDAASAAIIDLTRDWVAANGIRAFHDMEGICHIVLAQHGYLKPGMFAVGGDSHSPTGGAFGCFMFGIGATEMAGVLVTGEIWLRVPETILMRWTGRFGRGVVAKDVMLFLCAELGMGGGDYQVVQFAGEAIAGLAMQERMTLCNMTAELGAQTGIIAADEVTADYLSSVGAEPGDVADWQFDAGAAYRRVHDFDAGALEPQVAAPHTPAKSRPAADYGAVAIDTAYIGACTGAKLADLRMAAAVLAGRKVAAGVRLLVAPASLRDREAATAEGTMETLVEAGATLLPSACGACAGYGDSTFGENVVCISTTARNFKGRMGADSAQVYLASPYTVAASAVAGRIRDPRDILA